MQSPISFASGDYVQHRLFKAYGYKGKFMVISTFENLGRLMLRLEGQEDAFPADDFERTHSPQEERFTLDAIDF